MYWMNEGQRITSKLICKHCKVPVCSRLDLRAILGREHAKSCPRYRWGSTKKS